MQRKEEDRKPQKINSNKIFAENARNIIADGYKPLFEGCEMFTGVKTKWDPFTGFVIAVLHSATLAARVPIQGGIKTLVDVASRNPLSNEEIAHIIKTMSELDNDKFDTFVNHILQYQPKSEDSKNLLNRLHYEKEDEETKINAFMIREKRKVKQENLSPLLKQSSFQVDVDKVTYTFTKDDLSKISKKVDDYKMEMLMDRRKKQQQFIIDYLNNNDNAGKRLETLINEELQDKTKTEQKSIYFTPVKK